jgi:hypothetical protein
MSSRREATGGAHCTIQRGMTKCLPHQPPNPTRPTLCIPVRAALVRPSSDCGRAALWLLQVLLLARGLTRLSWPAATANS